MRLRTNHASSWKPLVFSAELRRNRIEETQAVKSKSCLSQLKNAGNQDSLYGFFQAAKERCVTSSKRIVFVPKCAAPHGFVAASAGNFSPHISMGKGNHCHKNVSALASKRSHYPKLSLQGNGHAKKSYDKTFGFHFRSQKSGRKRQSNTY